MLPWSNKCAVSEHRRFAREEEQGDSDEKTVLIRAKEGYRGLRALVRLRVLPTKTGSP